MNWKRDDKDVRLSNDTLQNTKTFVITKRKSPNIMALISRSTDVSYWVATEIVMEKDAKKRKRILKKFVAVADVRSFTVNVY